MMPGSTPAGASRIHIPVNNPPERIQREIRRCTRVITAFPGGQSVAAARLRHMTGTNIELLKDQQMRGVPSPLKPELDAVQPKPKVRNTLDTTGVSDHR